MLKILFFDERSICVTYLEPDDFLNVQLWAWWGFWTICFDVVRYHMWQIKLFFVCGIVMSAWLTVFDTLHVILINILWRCLWLVWLFCSGGTVMSGWLPIFDTLHGIRGEINLIIKVPNVDIFVLILILKGRFLLVLIFLLLYSTLLHLPPLRFHCVGECWDQTQDCCNLGIGSQTF